MPEDVENYVRIAWTFLDLLGYINFGVSPNLLARHRKEKHPRGSVVVVGAGLAGKLASFFTRAQNQMSMSNSLGQSSEDFGNLTESNLQDNENNCETASRDRSMESLQKTKINLLSILTCIGSGQTCRRALPPG